MMVISVKNQLFCFSLVSHHFSSMRSAKVILIGAPGVGKTSLVLRYVACLAVAVGGGMHMGCVNYYCIERHWCDLGL